MRTRAVRPVLWGLLALIVQAGPARAQARVTLAADLLFYGDNTEFRNPFREGETIFGTAGQLAAEVDVTPHVQIRLGAFGNLRFGSDSAFESVRPVVSIAFRGKQATFLMGTFPAPRPPTGPDRGGPHGLLPAVQRETLAFDRPHEAGLQWTFVGSRVRHEAWINWQRVNTPEHRERFDTGLSAQFGLKGWLALPVHLHIVHEGGQLHAKGPVSDSMAVGTGVSVSRRTRRFGLVSLDLLGLASRYVPNREARFSGKSGAAVFVRAAAERDGWRAHTIFWRGDDYIKDEGDPNYQSIRRDGSTYRGVRDYAEAGLTRRVRLAPEVALEASARLHRTEKHYAYSYRVIAIAAVRARVR